MLNASKIYDITVAFGLYKLFPRYSNHTYEDVHTHIAPSIELDQYKIHYNKGVPYAFTNWAFLNEDAEQRFMTTAILNPEDYNSGNRPWYVDMVCTQDLKTVMKWLKQHFTNLLGYNKPVKWLRVSDDDTIRRVVTHYTKEHYGRSN
jgi:cytolysin-activating lysine-acyltransferase